MTEKAAPTPAKKPGRARAKPPAARAAAAQPTPAAESPAPVAAPPLHRDQASPAEPAAGPGRAPQAMAEALARGSSGATARKLAENIERIEALGQRLMAALTARPRPNPGIEAPGPDLFLTAANAWVKTLSEQPARILENQVNYWGETLKNYASAHRALTLGKAEPEGGEGHRGDKRFANPLWDSHPYFSFVKRQYLINSKALKDAAGNLQLSDDTARRRITWLTDQIVDMMAPTNFLATNPDALERAVETEGESLVRGLENLVRDVERNSGDIVVSLADRDAFSIGDNIGTSEGRVVHRTPLYELIQYRPATDRVFETPLLIFPPWINKFYILDLKPQNSLIKWLTEQGHTLFVVSWKNPDSSYADVGLEEYVAAYLEAMDKVRDLTAQPRLNVVGYCIAGTTLSLTLALLKQRNDDRVASATLFTTLTDFSDQGEFVSFLQDDFVTGIADEVKRHGLLRAQLMSRTMSFLRPNDLVWGPAIRSYMMGESPPAFDLLFWNGDSTNLPGKMAMQYLRGLCQQNAFATGGFELMGHKLHLSDVTTPLCAIACETDHIAPWKDCWRGVAGMGSKDKTFILSESGHIAGIVNPPTKKKYGHYLGSTDFGGSYQDWKESASFAPGTWWTRWADWLAERAGGMVPAREPEAGLCPAPGTYVHERAA
ncbi:class I poly(R)-hydroxyalkanoic acid synthase [Paracoccus sp. S3-43]|uniref:class I poly(R)-hydroxyalkanoic acid synthase n=1 Tax=Paracoccus sp. S3-43 TaxID=3030011 RepID=UPI0023B0566B|nr:class I poly(R)-hydroxyalkanoic acid synthase [Paracoccus sp. S3-43]WEF22883.1 class I poly(R)-hydroxyalkanoic acid synthase [Paracoccus sp. S3-43]